MMNNIQSHTQSAIDLLKKMIAISSFSREEDDVADMLFNWMTDKGLSPVRKGNNIWVKSPDFNNSKPTILLNSHLDTVRPGDKWTVDPFDPIMVDGKLIGLGSNDAGASAVSLIHTFLSLIQSVQPNNFILAITAEEEVSGVNGISSVVEEFGPIDLGVVGEPTQMQMAIAERGLLVLDCYVDGQTGHAAREEGVNAIYKALPAIDWFKNHPFTESKGLLGPVKMSVTMIDAGKQHNVVPDSCHFVVDIRINESYTNKELFHLIEKEVDFKAVPRSFRLNSSYIDPSHSIVQRGLSLGKTTFGSPTSSDQGLLKFTTLKIGPGDSSRSHTPDEFIFESEIESGIQDYYEILNGLNIK